MPITDAEVGRRFAAEREHVSMSQRDLATIADLSQSTIHRIETGARPASTLEQALIADACGVLVSDLTNTNSLANEVRCAGRTNETCAQAMSDYLLFAFGLASRLDALGVPDVA